MLVETGFVDIQISQPYDTFGEARGEKKARLFDVYGYTFSLVSPVSILSESSVALMSERSSEGEQTNIRLIAHASISWRLRIRWEIASQRHPGFGRSHGCGRE